MNNFCYIKKSQQLVYGGSYNFQNQKGIFVKAPNLRGVRNLSYILINL